MFPLAAGGSAPLRSVPPGLPTPGDRGHGTAAPCPALAGKRRIKTQIPAAGSWLAGVHRARTALPESEQTHQRPGIPHGPFHQPFLTGAAGDQPHRTI